MLYIHEQYSDYERLLHANPARGYAFFHSTLLNPNLREGMLNDYVALQAIFCGITKTGAVVFPNAANINELLVSEGYDDAAFLKYLTYLGYVVSSDLVTTLQNNAAAIFSDSAALAAMLQSGKAMQAFIDEATLWTYICNNADAFRSCMCSYWFCEHLAQNPTKFADIRANATTLTAFNTNKKVMTTTTSYKETGAGVYFVMIIGAGGKGGNGGTTCAGGRCCGDNYYNTATNGNASADGNAGKAFYRHYTGYSTEYKNAGGGGGRGSVRYFALRIKRGVTQSLTPGSAPTINASCMHSTIITATYADQTQTLPDIDKSQDATGTTNAAKGYGGYGYGVAASGNNFLGEITAGNGTAAGSGGDAAGVGGKGVGAGGGGAGGAGSNNKQGTAMGAVGGAAAPGCIALYRGW